MYVNWGISINLPYYYKKKLNNKYNSIQFHFDNNKITDKDIEKIKFFFNNNKKLKNVFVHSSYKINIGSPFIKHNNKIYNYSIEILEKEIEFMKKLNLKNIVLHTGKNKEHILSNKTVLKNMFVFINYILNNHNINIILETSSGQGSETLCDLKNFVTFIQLFKKNKNYENLGICIDTCHIFQAGYDININKMILEVHKIFKPINDKIKVIHLNDSYHEVGMKIDRHEIIGKGKIKPKQLNKFVSVYRHLSLINEF